MKNLIKVSGVVHTLNEEKNIKDCLETLKWCDEIIVIDMHSTDMTVEIAKKYTDKIFFHERLDYADPARNFGMQKANNNWILILDADERIGNDLREKLIQIARDDTYDVVFIPFKNIIFGQWIKHTKWWPNHHPRFFKKGKLRHTGRVHDSEKAEGKILYLKSKPENAIIHYNYQSVSHFMSKLDLYTYVEAKYLKEDGVRFSVLRLITKPIKEFIWRYINGQGFRDGLLGFVLSVLMAYYWFVAYLKLWELTKNKKD